MADILIFSLILVVCFACLKTVFYTDVIVTISLGILAWTLAEMITKAVSNALPKKQMNSSDKAVFITGCDTGFGNELAKKLDAMGFYVYAGCLFPDKTAAKELKEKTSDRLRIISLDVTSEEDVKAAVKEVTATLDGKELWALVNNAGISTYTEIEWCPVDTYRKIFEVNALGPIRVTKAFLPLLRESQGRVVIVASLAGRYTFPGFSAYSMSKYAAVSFADALRREMKKWRISVHTVEPTLYKTPIAAEDSLKSVLKNTWDNTPTDIQDSYGQEYYQAFQERLVWQLGRARDNVNEVVDDMVDAVAGTSPKLRYVPSVAAQIRARFLSTLPTEFQDFLLCMVQPKCPPAAAKPINSRIEKLRPEFRRTQSEPVKMRDAAVKLLRSLKFIYSRNSS